MEAGEAVLTTFDPSKAVTLFEDISLEDISQMSESEYNEAMNIFNTNVAVETHLQEVADEKNLKKAEAKYEADMRCGGTASYQTRCDRQGAIARDAA